ncbi:hypothetical protein LCGC14_0234820 [marine sediment metagenome]|uniref:Uncharacterized protein n=1 Tax=marine sediment metagenome TaxID=412755 RepID=A0A0F9WTK9_9ZZZZ
MACVKETVSKTVERYYCDWCGDHLDLRGFFVRCGVCGRFACNECHSGWYSGQLETNWEGYCHECRAIRDEYLEEIDVHRKAMEEAKEKWRTASIKGEKKPRGFTLIEVLIALGILGVGLSMAASVFVAAIKENEKSYNDSVGMMISENGLVLGEVVLGNWDTLGRMKEADKWPRICKAWGCSFEARDALEFQFHYSNNPGHYPPPLSVLIDEMTEEYLGRNSQHYIRGLPPKIRGFVLLGREERPDRHQLIALSYSREAGNTIGVVRIPDAHIRNDRRDPDRSAIGNLGVNLRFMKLGGYVVLASGKGATRYARIVGLPEDEARCYVTPRLMDADPPKTRHIMVVVEIIGDNPPRDQRQWKVVNESSVLAAMQHRTAFVLSCRR